MRIGNASGFYGDRLSAMREMLTGGPLDVLTGDYLAELTMLILGRDRLKDPGAGYAKTFLRQLEDFLGLAHEKGVRIVTNAGGLNPAGLADAVRELAAKAGIPVAVAHVEGDDLMQLPQPLPYGEPGAGAALTANAYLGGAGITACLRAGAEVVVTGRVTDAALVTGPAAWWFDWGPQDYDRLAGAVVAGHVLECGTQATGGNYAFFDRPGTDVRRPGFPLAEIAADGSSVITKHPGTGGLVSAGTVTAQLLYETQGVRYLGPDVTARLDTVRLSEVGADRVGIEGVVGEPPPPTLKVGVTRIGGWRNEVVFVLTGLDIEAKAALVREQLAETLEGVGSAEWTLARTDHADAATEETASALLRLVVRDASAERVGRPLTSAAIELALGSYPGFHVTAVPGPPQPYGIFTAHTIPPAAVRHEAILPTGTRLPIPPHPAGGVGPEPPDAVRSGAPDLGPGGARTAGGAGAESGAEAPDGVRPGAGAVGVADADASHGPGAELPDGVRSGARAPGEPGAEAAPAGCPRPGTTRAPLGRVVGARSGDKGGDANLGVWVETDDAYAWLEATLTVDEFRRLLPETAGLTLTRHALPNLRALNFTIEGILGDGVAAAHRFDPQAKALGEWLRARHLDIPTHLIPTPEAGP
ncbi:exopolyphosphatase [Streptomyces venezuelae]|uniref:Exopolyphosphatase n=1 Tax=Streptomyces venezuelae TaxID=54571 RepID=A0A5P2DB62_STRVZ|nr:exopolyphosphatase [Streptomyces venezuelae]